MKIAFLGLKQAFDYFQIGGTESFVRRLSAELMNKGIKVEYILYGCEDNSLKEISGITLNYLTSFELILRKIENERYDHIVGIYFLPKDRIKFALSRKRKNLKRTHFIYFSWPDLWLKRYLYFAEARLFPYNGKLFCISKRQYEYVSKWAKNSVHILPPVPDNYFLKPEGKPNSDKIKVTFLGRINPGKGIDEVISIFDEVGKWGKFDCKIYGIYNPEDKGASKVRDFLVSQKEIEYIEFERTKWSPEVENQVGKILTETDIFFQPYKRLSSTIDTPVLLLEAMASLCAVVTKPYGNIPDIYGKSKFLLPKDRFADYIIDLMKNITYEDIIKERNRIFGRNLDLNFKISSVANRFLKALGD